MRSTIAEQDIPQVQGADAYDINGDKIDRAGQVYLDDQTGRPEWVTVNTGLCGMNESFIPLPNSSVGGRGLTVPFTKDNVTDAPQVDPDNGHRSQDEERAVYAHSGKDYSWARSASGLPAGGTHTDRHCDTRDLAYDLEGAPGHDTFGPNTDDAVVTLMSNHLPTRRLVEPVPLPVTAAQVQCGLSHGPEPVCPSDDPSGQLDLLIAPQATGRVASNRLLSEEWSLSEGRSAPWITMCRSERFVAMSLGTTTER